MIVLFKQVCLEDGVSMNFDLREKAKEHVIVVAHRGASGGNIPCNTMAAYEIALMQGADMLEIDVDCTRDGELIIFHPGMEKPHLGTRLDLSKLSYSSVKKLRYRNVDETPTLFGVSKLDDFLEAFKGRCFINVDKFWGNPEKIYNAIKRHGMTEQMLVKSAMSPKVIDVLESIAPELPFMPIVREQHPMHEALLKRNINYVGVEVLFKNDDSSLAGEAFIEKMHRDSTLVWVNSIIYDYKEQLSGGHSDDTALTVSRDYGWGWLADCGFDFIQTDWPMMLIDYLRQSGKYNRK